MGLVRAKKDVYLNQWGHHVKGSEFEYDGPDNENIESIEAGPYAQYSEGDLRAEINRRGLTYVAVATHKDLQAVLVGDDAAAKQPKVEPKPRKPKQGPRGPGAEKEVDGSGSEKYGASDWTAAGQDVDGFPVEKGAAGDVTV